MKSVQPPEGVEQHQFREWHMLPMTKRFFDTIEQDRVTALTAAASHAAAHNTGIGNAMEHNRLIRAAAFKAIIDKYGNPTKYPYSNAGSDSADA
jgi:hypothetical protein